MAGPGRPASKDGWREMAMRPRSCQDLTVDVRPRGRSGRRGSTRERDSVARRLRAAYVEGELSVETFAERVEALYAARTRAELGSLVTDVSPIGAIGRAVVHGVERVSESFRRIVAVARRPRTRPLVLPTHRTVFIGRSRFCDCVLGDPSVSRRHALLTFETGKWRLRDLGSLNGTYVNGCRVVDEVTVEPGDAVAFGCEWFSLVSPGAPAGDCASGAV